MEEDSLFPDLDNSTDIFIMPMGDKARDFAVGLAFQLRKAFYSCEVCYEQKGMGQMFKKAERRTAKLAFIIGDDEILSESVTVKKLDTKEQVSVKLDDLDDFLAKYFNNESEHHHHECECCEGDDCECEQDHEEEHCCHHHEGCCKKA